MHLESKAAPGRVLDPRQLTQDLSKIKSLRKASYFNILPGAWDITKGDNAKLDSSNCIKSGFIILNTATCQTWKPTGAIPLPYQESRQADTPRFLKARNPKSRCQQGQFFLEDLKENLFSAFLLTSGGSDNLVLFNLYKHITLISASISASTSPPCLLPFCIS